jgi:hypothetical protein
MKKSIHAVIVVAFFVGFSAVAGETCADKDSKVAKAGCQVGHGTREIVDKSAAAAKKGVQRGQAWWADNTDEVQAKAVDAAQKAGEIGKKAVNGTGRFLKGFGEGFRR